MTEDKEKHAEWYAAVEAKLAIAQSKHQHPLPEIITKCMAMHIAYEAELANEEGWTEKATYFAGARTAYATILDAVLIAKGKP